jgi:hypothetical protein
MKWHMLVSEALDEDGSNLKRNHRHEAGDDVYFSAGQAQISVG